MGCLLPLHMMILMNIIFMCLLLLLAIIMREELHLHLSMFPTRIFLQETSYTMHWPLLDVHELIFYDMLLHRKRVILHHCMIYVALYSLLNAKSLLIEIGFDIPWDPGGFIT